MRRCHFEKEDLSSSDDATSNMGGVWEMSGRDSCATMTMRKIIYRKGQVKRVPNATLPALLCECILYVRKLADLIFQDTQS